MGIKALADGFAVGKCELGWVFIGFSVGRVQRIAFGYSDRRRLLHAVSEWLDGRVEAVPPCDLLRRIDEYAKGRPETFADIEIDIEGATPFRRKVLRQCRIIPYGETLSYGELAVRAGSDRAARAVGRCMATNPIPLVVPCHRVIGHDGRLVAFSSPGGCTMKRRLLNLEKQG